MLAWMRLKQEEDGCTRTWHQETTSSERYAQVMDWDVDRVRHSKAWTHQKARQNANLERIVLKARCAVCDARLIKTQVYVTKDAARNYGLTSQTSTM